MNEMLRTLEESLFETKHYPAIDWELGAKLVGNKPDAAREMLALLIQNLPEDISNMKNALDKKDYTLLQQQAHKLHGALCYCGVPRLKIITATLETSLKHKKMEMISGLFTLLEKESLAILQSFK